MRPAPAPALVLLLCACQPSTIGKGDGDGNGDDVSGSGSESAGTEVGSTDLDTGTGTSTSTSTDSSTSTSTDSSTDTDVDSSDTTTGANADIGPEAWNPGVPVGLVPGGDLLTLPTQPSGPPIWVSNNPERFLDDGWLTLHSRTDPQRGGMALPLAGSFPAYLFHLNGTGGGKWLHLVATNPSPQAVTISMVGSLFSNNDFPLNGPGTGPSYAVSRDWLEGSPDVDSVPKMIGSGQGAVLLSKYVGANQFVDGRFEVSASDGVYLYAVITNSSSATPAINATQGAPAPGEILMPGPNAYGRESGVYEHGELLASFSAELPPDPGHLGFCFNTAGKFPWQGVTLQEQTAAGLAILSDSAERTWGNYGHRLRVEIELVNSGGDDRMLTLALGSLFTAAQDQPSFTWSAPMRVGPQGSEQVVEVWTTPTAPVDPLGTWPIAAGDSVVMVVEVYVPGLITAGQQLQLIVD